MQSVETRNIHFAPDVLSAAIMARPEIPIKQSDVARAGWIAVCVPLLLIAAAGAVLAISALQ